MIMRAGYDAGVATSTVPSPTGSSGRAGARPSVIPTGPVYRGAEGMWSWVAHRITGIAIFFFLYVHILDTALVTVSPEAYNVVIETYKNPVVGLMEVGLVGAVLFHAFNGLRIVLVDFWARGPRVQRQMLIGVLLLWVVLMIPFTIRHLGNVFGG
jgi:succinate dehydrogenase / fumarate reductase cytochrome b subunit